MRDTVATRRRKCYNKDNSIECVGVLVTFQRSLCSLIPIPLKSKLYPYKTIDKVGQLLWAWFSRLRKSSDKIVDPWHTVDFIVCNFVQYQLASRIHNSRMQIAK